MPSLDRFMWACVDFCATRSTPTAFTLALLAAVVLVGAIEGIR